jgi:hypothetical protein
MPWHDSSHGGINHHHDDINVDDSYVGNESVHEIQNSNHDNNYEDHNDSHEHNLHEGHHHGDNDDDDYDNEGYSENDDDIDYIPSWNDDWSDEKRVKYDLSKRHRTD